MNLLKANRRLELLTDGAPNRITIYNGAPYGDPWTYHVGFMLTKKLLMFREFFITDDPKNPVIVCDQPFNEPISLSKWVRFCTGNPSSENPPGKKVEWTEVNRNVQKEILRIYEVLWNLEWTKEDEE